MDDYITLEYGSGGSKTSELIRELILPAFHNPVLSGLGDAALIAGERELCFSTDSFVVSPLFFPGGDIGKLAVCGSLNDVAMAGGEPRYLSFSLVIEEGFPVRDLRRILSSAGREAEKAGVLIVTGDTKVVEKGSCDGLFINTACIGFRKAAPLGPGRVKAGDKILISGPVGDHGMTIMLARHPSLLSADLSSDCANVAPMAGALFSLGEDLRLLRDPTRGGIATILSELAAESECGFMLWEDAIPISVPVKAACDILGLDALYSACEGRLTAVVAPEKAEEALSLLRAFPEGAGAAAIGEITAENPGRLTLKTALGSSRFLRPLSGGMFPRIC